MLQDLTIANQEDGATGLDQPREAGLLVVLHKNEVEHSKKKIITPNFEKADNLPSQMRGLMFRLRPKALLFTFSYSGAHPIHSLFVFFPFDAIYLDAGKRAVDLHSHVPPFSLNRESKKPASFLLELPAGSIEKFKIEVGDKFNW